MREPLKTPFVTIRGPNSAFGAGLFNRASNWSSAAGSSTLFDTVSVKPSSRRRGRPPRVSRGQILAAALRIVDEQGLEQLTIRRLGTDTGEDPDGRLR
jgi:hypothetical protein